jgi:hypothetical protein
MAKTYIILSDQTAPIVIGQNSDQVYYYCGRCSGCLYLKDQDKGQLTCFSCGWDIHIDLAQPLTTLSFLKSAPTLPSEIIDQVRLQKTIQFEDNYLMKTRKKEQYRFLYNHFQTLPLNLPQALKEFPASFSQIINDGHFTDDLLKVISKKYGKATQFYMHTITS